MARDRVRTVAMRLQRYPGHWITDGKLYSRQTPIPSGDKEQLRVCSVGCPTRLHRVYECRGDQAEHSTACREYVHPDTRKNLEQRWLGSVQVCSWQAVWIQSNQLRSQLLMKLLSLFFIVFSFFCSWCVLSQCTVSSKINLKIISFWRKCWEMKEEMMRKILA